MDVHRSLVGHRLVCREKESRGKKKCFLESGEVESTGTNRREGDGAVQLLWAVSVVVMELVGGCMRNRILGAIGLIWGLAILGFRFFGSSGPPTGGAYGAGQTVGLLFGSS